MFENRQDYHGCSLAPAPWAQPIHVIEYLHLSAYRLTQENWYSNPTIESLSKMSMLTQKGQTAPLYAAGIGYSRNLSRLPSWVPDWTAKPSMTILGSLAETAASSGVTGFQACGTEVNSPSIIFDADNDSIKINARIIDKIRFIADPAPGATMEFGTAQRNELHASQFTWLMSVLQLLFSQPLYSTGEQAFPNCIPRTFWIPKGFGTIFD